MNKEQRQERVRELLAQAQVANQSDLVEKLAAEGIEATQATVSRDLIDLGAVKLKGFYRLPEIEASVHSLMGFLQIDSAGEHLAVIRTAPGHASMIALAIDQEEWPEVVGTLAGDDTIFVACKGRFEQQKAVRKVLRLFRHDINRRGTT